MTHSSHKRKRGAQPGNSNALRHGFYSKQFTEVERQNLDHNIQGEFLDEIALARIQVGRLASIVSGYQSMAFEDFIAASNALCNYLDRIQRLTRAQQFMYRNQTTVEQALAELAHLNPDED